MADVLFLSPDPDHPEYGARWPSHFARYAKALAGAGVSAAAHPWTAPAEVRARLVLPVLAWGYHHAEAAWRAAVPRWAEAARAAGAAFANPPEAVLWNTRKTYLAELQARGVSVAPTLFLDAAGPAEVAAAFDRLGAPEIVLKPQVSGGGFRTVRLRPGDPVPPADRPLMIQPFLPAVQGEGELSLLFFDGALSHAVAKVAAEGEFRVQPQYGGRFAPYDPSPEALDLAQAALASVPAGPMLYARVDLVRLPQGRLALMELEIIEPDLYLEHAPDAPAAFAQAVRRALAQAPV